MSASHSVMSDSLEHHGPLIEFSRQEYCSGLPLPSPGHLPDLTGGSDWSVLHCRWILYPLSHQGSL